MNPESPPVLVVDDDQDLLDLVTMILERRGHRVVQAHDGSEALQAVAREMPSLILLDLKMPVMDGYQFARLFRERYDGSAPIVVVTAADDARRRAAEIDAAAVVSKPFQYDNLRALVDRLRRT